MFYLMIVFSGSEAAAATAIIMGIECCIVPQPPIEFKVDRPFLFAIQDIQRGITLFQGQFISANI